MCRSYSREIAELPSTFQCVLSADTQRIESLLARMAGRSAFYVASGGALAVARLSSDLHNKWLGAMATAVTPLEYVGLNTGNGALVAISARAKHRDLDLALREARAHRSSPITVLTFRVPERYELQAKAPVEFLTLPVVAADGFLATNSVLLMAGLITKAHLAIRGNDLPDTLPWLAKSWNPLDSLRPLGVILHAPPTAAVAIDLEARLSETGLTQTQVTDYRNFAHGRHRGFQVMSSHCSVIAIIHPSNKALIEETLGELPKDVHLVKLETALAGFPGVLDLLVASMKITETTSKAQELEPAKSEVPPFGRRLYHMDPLSLVKTDPTNPIRLKMAAAGILSPDATTYRAYESAYRSWKQRVSSQVLVGLLLDYDGTCTHVADRDAPPPHAVQEGVVRLLAAGIPIGFASGRGRSLSDALKSWISQKYWSSITLGLYNGSYRIRLSDKLEDMRHPKYMISEAYQRISAEPFSRQLLLEPRTSQLTISPRPHYAVVLSRLAHSISEILSRPPALHLRVALSAHSIDIVTEDTSKVTLLEEMEQAHSGRVLAIGDQGALDGNDFQMLSCTPFSLTVDHCSGDVTRCWHLEGDGTTGPDLLGDYLARLYITGKQFTLNADMKGETTR